MKRQFCIIVFTILGLQGFAQERAAYKDAVKLWEEGPLTEADFSVRHLPNTSVSIAGELDWGIRSDRKVDKIGNLRFEHPVSYSYMDKLNSWRDPDYAHPWSMDYFQTMFDLVELNRRKMQADMDANPQDCEEIKDYYNRSVHSQTEALEVESDKGNDAAVVARYQVRCKEDMEALAKTQEDTPLKEPAYRHTAVGIGMYAGYEGEAFSQPLADVLGMRHQLFFGWVFPINQVYTSLDFAAALKAPVKVDGALYDQVENYDWRKDKPYTGGQFNFRLGYRVFDQARMAVIPFTGIGGSFIRQDTGREDSDGDAIISACGGLRLQGGILLHWKYLRHLTLGNYEREYGEHALAFRLYGARTTFRGLPPAWSVNFGVCVDVTAWPLKSN